MSRLRIVVLATVAVIVVGGLGAYMFLQNFAEAVERGDLHKGIVLTVHSGELWDANRVEKELVLLNSVARKQLVNRMREENLCLAPGTYQLNEKGSAEDTLRTLGVTQCK